MQCPQQIIVYLVLLRAYGLVNSVAYMDDISCFRVDVRRLIGNQPG